MTLHNIPPVFDSNSETLILGSFPSVKSREEKFFYAHKQNRFWKVISKIFDESEPQTVEEKKALLLRHNIALWDVIASCDIDGSSDSSVKNAKPNDIFKIIKAAKINKIILNGKTAAKYYKEYLSGKIDIPAICLPSTSPANAVWSLERLTVEWKNIFE